MGSFALNNCKLYIAQYDVSGDHNSLELTSEVELLDKTTFGASSRAHLGGLESIKFDHNGYTDFADDAIEEIIQANLAQNVVVTVGPTGTDGERAFLFKRISVSITEGGEVGQMHTFQVQGVGTDRLVQGTFLHPLTSRSTSGNGTARQLGAVSATQRLYSNLHVTAKTGSPTLDVLVQSDDGGGFGSPVTRITHTQATNVTSQQSTVAGAITDDWYRTNYTFGGTGSITFVHSVGIK